MTSLHHIEVTHITRKRLNQKGSFHALKICLLEPHWKSRTYFITRRKQIENIEKFKKYQRKTCDLVTEASIANNLENFTVNNVHFSLETTSHCLRNKLGLFFPDSRKEEIKARGKEITIVSRNSATAAREGELIWSQICDCSMQRVNRRGLIREGGLFTKSSNKFGGFSVLLSHILRNQDTILRLKYVNSTQFLFQNMPK